MEENTHKHLKSENNTFTIEEVYRQGWLLVKNNWVILFGIGATFIALELLQSALLSLSEKTSEPGSFIAITNFIVVILAYYFCYLLLSNNSIKTLIHMSRDRSVSLSNIFVYNAGDIIKYFKIFVANILYMLCVLVGILLFIVPGIYLSMRYQFVTYLIIDKNLPIIESFRASSKMTDGQTWHLFGLTIVYLLTLVVGLLALIVGVIPAFMLITMSHVYLYKKLSKKISTGVATSSQMI